MSKRYPLSAASKAFEFINQQEGGAELLAKIARCGDLDSERKILQKYTDARVSYLNETFGDTYSKEEVTEVWYLLAASDKTIITPADLTWASRWSRCRNVYRVSPEFANELANTDLDEEIPTDVLLRLPYPIIFVESTSSDSRAAGFLAYLITEANGATSLGLTTIMRSGERLHDSIPINGSTTLRELVEQKSQTTDDDGSATTTRKEWVTDEIYMNMALDMSQMINTLLYIISAADDIEVIHTPPTGRKPGQKVGRKTNPETLSLVGAKMGRAIGAARRQAASQTTHKPTGQTKAPHVRAAHWAHYWVGPRKNRIDGKFGDRLVLKWIPPINVNEDLGDVVETIHN